MITPILMLGAGNMGGAIVDGWLNNVIARVGSRLPEAVILSTASRIMKRTTAASKP